MRFWKLEGAGNDFVLLAGARVKAAAALARRLCDRRRGIGADGLLLVQEGRRPSLRYLNADGSEAFCGNGARCAALWLSRQKPSRRSFSLDTAQGALGVEILSKTRAAVRMPAPSAVHVPRALEAAGCALEVLEVDTGVPHAVVFVKNLADFPVVAVGRALRRHRAFAPAGANVDFVQISGRRLRVRTYERGVEDETLACGTGVVAAAIAAALLRGARSPIDVETRGGDVLHARFTRRGAGFSDVWLEGPGAVVYQGEID